MDPTAEELIQRLRGNPDDSEAFAALRAHYHRRQDYASLANLLEGWAARHPNPNAAANAFFEAGELVNGYLSDRGRAVSLYERALERDPHHMDASARLQDEFEAQGDMRRLLELLDKRAAALEEAGADPRHVAATHYQIGELWEQRLSRVDRAIAHYRKAFELDNTLVQAIYAAREIYRHAGNYKAAASLYDMEANAETDRDRKVALFRELAHVRREQLGDLEGAIVSLGRAIKLVPGDLSVLHDLSTVLLARAELGADPMQAISDRTKAADLLYQMAQKVSPDHGLAYTESALDAAPDHDGALDLLERLAAETGREDLLPVRWVAYLQAAPESPSATRIRRKLGKAYVDAGQIDDAIVCFEPLLARGDAEAAEALVELYKQSGEQDGLVRALSVAVAGLPPEKRIPRLREAMEILVSRDNPDGAADRAREILQIDPADPEALGFVEQNCRNKGAWLELRDLLLAAARVSHLSVDARKQRLREVASLSETKLEDPSGAISAWRAIGALDPADIDARKALDRLLEANERWDELVQVLEREALSLTDPDEKAELYRRIAGIHRDKRDSLMEAIDALRSLREIRPSDAAARDELCEGLVAAGAFLEAVPLLRKRVEAAEAMERATLLRQLASILEEKLGDDEGAFDVSTRLLDAEPGDLESISRMERIDERAENWDRLLTTLSYRSEVTDEDERAPILARMGQIADHQMGDLDRAAEYYAKALDLTPGDTETLDALCAVYDRSGRYRDLVVLLKERANMESEPAARGELYRRIARTLATRVRNEEAASEAWLEVLAAGEDREALEYLADLARRRGDAGPLAELVRRIILIATDTQEKIDLLLERASLLADELDDKGGAIEGLREIVEKLAPEHIPALTTMARLCEETGDQVGLADALERQLSLTEDDGLKVPLAMRLATLYEKELDDRPRAIAALRVWAEADFTDPEPQRRLIGLYEAAGRHEELLGTLDSLAGIEQDDAAVGELVRRAAQLAMQSKGDVDGAWGRLAPRVGAGDADAETQLRELAREVARGEQLAQLYVELAQNAEDLAEQKRRWVHAASVFEEYLGDADKALEATLRAFASDLKDASLLESVDRLAARSGAWERLRQVYDTLLRQADDADKIQLLLRQATILDEHGDDTSGALDNVLRACSLAPENDEVLARAEELAPKAGRADELIVVYDRRRQRAQADPERLEALLRSARTADGPLNDRERALGFIAQGVALTVRTPALTEVLEDAVRSLDSERTDLGPTAARLALVDLYGRLAERTAEDAPAAGGELLSRASRILADELSDENAAYGYLERATTFAPGKMRLLDELERFADRTGRLSKLDGHLAGLIAEALDQATAAELLKRRGQLLEEKLEQPGGAADVYSQLAALRPGDSDVSDRLRRCLRAAGRHQDLLVVLDREVDRAPDKSARIELLKAVALTWDRDLKNRWEALDAWKKVLSLDPDDDDASSAVHRLGHSTRRMAEETGEIEEPESSDVPQPSAPLGAPGSIPLIEADDQADVPPDDAMAFDDETEAGQIEDALAPAPGGSAEHPFDQAKEAVAGVGADVEAAAADDQWVGDAVGFVTGEVTDPSPPAPMPSEDGVFGPDEDYTLDPDDTGKLLASVADAEVPAETAVAKPVAEVAAPPLHLFDSPPTVEDSDIELSTGDIELPTGDVEIKAASAEDAAPVVNPDATGEISIDELFDVELDDDNPADDEIEELDAADLIEDAPLPAASTSAPPPPPTRSRTSTIPPPLPPRSKK